MPGISSKNVMMGTIFKPDVLTSLQDINVSLRPRLPFEPLEPIDVLRPVEVPTTPDLSTTIPVSPVHPFPFDKGILVGPIFIGELVKAFWEPRLRSELTVPISAGGMPNADTFFEAPADPNKKYALPLFNLSEQAVSGNTRLRVAIERVQPIDPANQKWQLNVRFGTARRRPDVEDLQFTSAVLLQFTPPISGAAKKELAFTVEMEDAATLKATLQMIGTTERDQVVNALKRFEYQTRFIVRCSFSAAVPDSFKDGMQLYRQNSYSVDVPLNLVDPFVFDPSQHPYIFSEVQDASEKVFGLKLEPLDYKGRTHHYYQDEASPHIFYFLPDSFKVARGSDPPFAPLMILHFHTEDSSNKNMKGSLEYVAVPVIDAERLQAARLAFKPKLPTPMPPDLTEAVFQPLIVDEVSQLTLNLAVPRKNTSDPPRQPRPGVVTKLHELFQDEISDLSIDELTGLYDAMFSKSPAAILFTGNVLVAKSGERPDETIPFSARLDDLFGPLLEETESLGADGRITVKLKNGIESPLTIRSVPAHILSDGQLFPAHIENLSKGGTPAQFPVDLAPGEDVSLDVIPDQPLPAGASAPDALFDLDDVVVRPDADAVYDTILDASVPAEYTREISVEGFEQWFAPDTDVMAIALDFVNGNHVTLDRTHLTAEGQVSVPLKDRIVRKVQNGEYHYTKVVVHTNVPQTRAEKTDNLGIIFPDPAT